MLHIFFQKYEEYFNNMYSTSTVLMCAQLYLYIE